MSYYEFKADDAWAFAKSIGRKHREFNGQIEFAFCPYCNGGREHDKKTFHISLSTGQFECKRASCGVKGNMITLARDFSESFQLSKDVTEYYRINGAGLNYKRFKDAHRKIESKDPAISYMESRGIGRDVTERYEITVQNGKDNVLVFPFKDEEGALQFVKYRNTTYKKGESDGSKEWCEKNCKPILFGMNHCTDFGTLVMTEGQIDSLSLAEAGIKNAVSVPTGKNGFTWVKNVWNWLIKFDELVIFGDNERGEITLAKEMTIRFPKKVRVVRESDYCGWKDANEILKNVGKDQLINCVQNAETKVSLRIKQLSDVDTIDYSELPSYRTGYKSLDEKIGNGFHLGEVIVLTGNCGEGKSTFASMITARMISNGLKCFCYSGELPGHMFRYWFDCQIYGKSKFKDVEREAIAKWYNNKAFIYDNSVIDDTEDNLFDVMAQSVRDLDCKFVLVDNMMTAMSDDTSTDLYRQQSAFIGKLTKFAQKFEIIILLIAHPKKNSDDSNDSISGSGDITNRANLVLRFQRKSRKKEDENISLLKITKNRTTGWLDFDGIEMKYDPKSRRIYENNPTIEFEEFMVEEETEFVQMEQEEFEVLPF